MKVLILDNYDSFVYNLAQYVGDIADNVVVKRNDEIDVAGVKGLSPDRIIISSGPGTPSNTRYFGTCTAILREISRKTPTLGVCLGHQGIVHAVGGGRRQHQIDGDAQEQLLLQALQRWPKRA